MDDASNSNGTLTTAPPPPPEVKIRTMRSDIETLAASGGAAPRFQNVKVAGLTAPEIVAAGGTRPPGKNSALIIVLVLILIVILAVVGWFAYGKLAAEKTATPTLETQTTTNQIPNVNSAQVATPTSSPTQTQSNQIILPTLAPTQTSTATVSSTRY